LVIGNAFVSNDLQSTEGPRRLEEGACNATVPNKLLYPPTSASIGLRYYLLFSNLGRFNLLIWTRTNQFKTRLMCFIDY
jgi:hypothetical protein